MKDLDPSENRPSVYSEMLENVNLGDCMHLLGTESIYNRPPDQVLFSEVSVTQSQP